MNEAEKMKNMTKMTTEKFMAFLKLVASKLIAFIDDMSVNCQYFSHDLNNIANKSVNSFVVQEKEPMRTNSHKF